MSRRLLIVEKPFWTFGGWTASLLRLAGRIWRWVLRVLTRDDVSLAVLSLYALAGAVTLSVWEPGREWIGIRYPADRVFLGVFLFWVLLLVVWTSGRMQERVLRWVPACLLSPVWVPPLAAYFGILACLTVALFVLSLLLMPAGVAAMLAGLAYASWRQRRGITLRCAKGECRSGGRFRDLEVRYVCRCGAEYPYLTPSFRGLRYHQCTCGARLPASPALRRKPGPDGVSAERTMPKRCPNGHPWGAGSDPLPTHFVAIAGGGSVGKTCYLTMAVDRLLNVDGAYAFRALELEDPQHRSDQTGRLRILSAGKVLGATTAGVPEAQVLRLSTAHSGDSRLYLYDAAGEEYSQVERINRREFEFFDDLTGILLLIDPLSLPKLSNPEIDARALAISQTPLDLVVASIRRQVSRYMRYGSGSGGDIPMAVVISKADAPAVEAAVGSGAVERKAAGRTLSAAEARAIERQLCRAALVAWGAENEIRGLETEFPQIDYFSCSALGRTPDESGQPFSPRGVLPPLLWLMECQEARRGKAALQRSGHGA